MKMEVVEHSSYPRLGPQDAAKLYESARKSLRVGFEIELNTRNTDEVIGEDEALTILEKISHIFEKEHGFVMAVGKEARSKKKMKRVFRDGRTEIEVPVEIDVDGYKEHLLVPYGYVDGSTPIELVTSPMEPTIAKVKEAFEKIYKVVAKSDNRLAAICLRNCGLHQTVVFEHLETKFPDTVVANAIQITRACLPGLFYLLSAGHLEQPSRSLYHRMLNGSVWRTRLNQVAKYSLIYPRSLHGAPEAKYWGLEYRYPDGTQSAVLAGAAAVINTAITLKAIKLSQFGVLKISDEYYQNAKREAGRFADKERMTDLGDPVFFPRLTAKGMLRFLTDEIFDTDKAAMPVLLKLLTKPVWARFEDLEQMTKQRHEQIGRELMSMPVPNEIATQLEMAVALDCSTAKDRKNAVRRLARKMSKSYCETSVLLRDHGYVWNQELVKFGKRW